MSKSNIPNNTTLTPPKTSWVLPYVTENLREVYTLGRKLGQGQFGITYHCTHNSTGRTYACKSISKKKLLCKEDYDDVWREIQIMHHLSEHPNVVRIHETYEDSFSVHLVMELCEGGELFDRIVQKGHYSERQAAKLIKTIVEVVEACHSLGVMHRDLKPENFMFDSVDEDAVLKSIDFGLSVFYKPGLVFYFLYLYFVFILIRFSVICEAMNDFTMFSNLAHCSDVVAFIVMEFFFFFSNSLILVNFWGHDFNFQSC